MYQSSLAWQFVDFKSDVQHDLLTGKISFLLSDDARQQIIPALPALPLPLPRPRPKIFEVFVKNKIFPNFGHLWAKGQTSFNKFKLNIIQKINQKKLSLFNAS
jgi:hypothetical protein